MTWAEDDPKPLAELKLGSFHAGRALCSRLTAGFIYGSAYYTGVSNIYRMDLTTQKVGRR